MVKINLLANKNKFIDLLKSTSRDGTEDLIKELEKMGFFSAPASAGYHLNVEGGLVQHSLYTCDAALAVWEAMKTLDTSVGLEVERESVIIASLLHDVCKSDVYVRSTKKRKMLLVYGNLVKDIRLLTKIFHWDMVKSL